MSDSSHQPMRKSDPPLTPLEGETLDAPPPPEPGTLTARTHSHDGDPHTASLPTVVMAEPFSEPTGFAIVRELGSGGMGIVYEARQTRLNRPVALKVLRGDRGNAQDVIRFLHEAEAVAAIKHPNVVQVYEFGQHSGGPFMALELLTGGTLSDRLRRDGRLTPQAAAELVAKLADAVQAAHDLGIVHRDLKPGNVLFDSENVPKITDFGLAKKTGGADLTRTQALMGTPAYMAPEQARGETRFVGPPADVWALGAILYECLTGKRAFEADDTWAVLRKVTDEAPPAPRTHVPGLPRDLELIALECLEKSPADRYPSAAALAADLENYLAGRPVSVRPAGLVERFTKWTKRNKVIAGAAVAVSLALLVGSAGSLAFGIQAARRGDELTRANSELIRSNNDLTHSRNEQVSLAGGLKVARDNLARQAGDLIAANNDAEERGYLSDVALAHQLWRTNDLVGMRSTLARCPVGRRRWEWHYLDGLSRPERAVYHLDSPPLALTYSPDGRTLAFVTLAGGLSAFDTATGQDRLGVPIFSSGGRNRAIAFRPDGKEMAVASGNRVYFVDMTAAKWKAEEFVPKKADGADGLRHNYLALGYTKDGRLLGASVKAGAKTDETRAIIRDVRTDAVVSTMSAWDAPNGNLPEPVGAAFSPDGTRFAASAADSGIRVGGKGEGVKFEAFQPVVVVWDIASGKQLNTAVGSSSLFGSVAFDPNGRQVGFGKRGLTGELHPGPQGGLVVRAGHSGEVLAVAFDRNNVLWSGGDDKIVLGLDRRTGDERFALRGCPQGVLRLAVSPDGKEVAAACGDIAGGGVVLRFDVDGLNRDVWRAPVTPDRVSLVTALAADGSRFAATDFNIAEGDETSHLTIRDTDGGFERVTKTLGMPLVAAMRPGGLVLLDRGKRLQLTNASGEPVKDIPLPENTGRFASPALACTPDGKTIALTDRDVMWKQPKDGPLPVRVRLLTWDADTGKPGVTGEADLTAAVAPGIRSTSPMPTAAATDRDGKRLAATFLIAGQAAGQNRTELRGALVVWDLATGKEVFRQLCDEQLRTVAFDPLGRVVVGGGTASGGAVFAWDMATGKKELTLIGHTRPVLAVAFGPDGRLATGGLDRVVKVWDTASGREILSLDGFAREVTHLAFTPDGKNLVAATGVDVTTTLMAGGLPTDWPAAEVRTFRGPK